MAATTLTQACSRDGARTCGAAESDHLRTKIALLSEELPLKDERWERLPVHRRPHYDPVHRFICDA